MVTEARPMRPSTGKLARGDAPAMLAGVRDALFAQTHDGSERSCRRTMVDRSREDQRIHRSRTSRPYVVIPLYVLAFQYDCQSSKGEA